MATQDTTQPAHVHDDPHLPHSLAGDGETIERVFADLNPDTVIPNNLVSAAPANSTPLTAAGVRAFGETVSGLTYAPSRFLGITTVGGDPETIGLPGGDVSPTFVAARETDLNPNKNDDHFEIGADAPLYYHPTIRGDIVSSSLDQDWWELSNFSGDSEENPGDHWFYFDRMERVITNASSGERLDLYFIKSFVPISVSYTAGLFKAAIRAFDSVKPTVELHQNDAHGSIIGGSGGDTIYLKAKDPGASDLGGDSNYPTPSGIYKISLKNLDTNADVAVTPAIPTAGENSVERTFSNLAEGQYQLTAYDGTGNTAVRTFTVDTTPPTLWVTDGDGKVLNDTDSTQNGWVKISATPSFLNGFSIFDDMNDEVPIAAAPPGSEFLGVALQQDFWYSAQACDLANNCVESSFVLVSPGG